MTFDMRPADMDKAAVRRRVGQRVRELRLQHGMTLKSLAAAVVDVSDGNVRWTADTVSNIQAGNGARVLQVEDALALAQVFDISLEELLLGEAADGSSPGPGRPRVGEFDLEAGKGLEGSQSERLPAWPPAPGQKRRLEAQADRAGISRAAMLRVVTEIGLQAVEAMSDTKVRKLAG